MKRLAVAFTGPSNSGKTTLIVKVANILINKYKVSIIKNDPKDKARFDKEGKDSYKFTETGADVVVTSPKKTTIFQQRQKNLDEIIEMLEFDILLVEGLKTLPLPRIAIFRNKLDEAYFNVVEAFAIDETIDKSLIPTDKDILDLNNPEMIVEWLLKNGREV